MKPKRIVLSYCPTISKPIVREELRRRKLRKEKAALRNIMEEAIVFAFGAKYPKLCPDYELQKVRAKMGVGK